MKNLKLHQRAQVQFPCQPIGMCSDNDNEVIYIIDGSLNLYCKSISNSDIITRRLSDNRLQIDSESILTTSQVRLVEFLVESGSILLASCDGQIILFNLRENCIETILKHPFGIHALRFSPDQGLVALLDHNNGLFILSDEFEVQHETNVILDNTSLNKPVGVGWGSKETQFFGLDGRPAKEKKTNQTREDKFPTDIIETLRALDGYHNKVVQYRKSQELDWHGDGRLLVTLSKLDNNKHQIKVWNRNLELQFMSDQLYCMETGLVSWVPNGQYICSAQYLDDGRQDIALFERNGLVHQRFSLPLTRSHLLITQLAWSKDSKILAILGLEYKYLDDNSEPTWMLMLYTCNNFHWYLKHVSYMNTDNSDLRICWSESQSSQFALISTSGIYRNYECLWEVTVAKQESVVAVIDADKLLVTPFNTSSVPPPLCAVNITIPEFISDIVLSNEFSGLIITSSGAAITMDRSQDKNKEITDISIDTRLLRAQQLSSSLNFKLWHTIQDIRNYTHWTFITKDDIIAIKHSFGEKPELYYIPEMKMDRSTSVFVFPKCLICNVCSDQVNAFAAAITCDGKIYYIGIDKHTSNNAVKVQPWTNEEGIQLVIPTIETACSVKCCKINDSPQIISMTRDMTLRMNDITIASNNCTSFAITDNYLIYTTIDNLLRFQLIKNIKNEKQGDWTRNIESGALLISADEATAKVILQMPRGNLEVLYPRILLFNLLVKLLDDRKFIEAVDMVRRHRINMNFIADYLHDLFEDTRELYSFVETIGYHDITWSNLFLSELNDEDTIAGQYKSVVSQLPMDIRERSQQHTSNKVDRICKCLKSLDHDPKLLQSYLISLIRQTPQRTDLALRKVGSLGDNNESGLRFLLYMIDIEKLFEEALGTYDTNIALMVANISNKDPKEYLKLIGEFNIIEDCHYRKFKIDLHIKRYDRAVAHLLEHFRKTKEVKARDELLNLVIDKRLFKDFINQSKKSGPVDEDLCKLVWHSYAQYLFGKRYYLESGIAYERAQEYSSAIKSYLLDADWSRALTVAAKLNEEDSLNSYRMIAHYLIADSKFIEGANILENFCDDYDEACQAYIKGHSFNSATRLATKCSNLDRNHLKEAITNYSSDLIISLQISLEKNKIYFERFNELRTELENKRRLSQLTGESIVLDSDTLSTIDGSDASSQTSDTSRSGASSLKTRKPSNSKVTRRKKKINLKQGSRYEDIALLHELKCFIQSQDQNFSDGRSVCSSLCDMSLEIEYRKVIVMINDCVKDCYDFSKLVSDSIWPMGPSNLGPTTAYNIFLEKQNSPNPYTFDVSDMELLVRPRMPSNFTPFIL